MMFLALCNQKVSDEKTATLGVGVTLNKPCSYGYQSPDDNIFFKFVFKNALPEAVFGLILGLLMQISSA